MSTQLSITSSSLQIHAPSQPLTILSLSTSLPTRYPSSTPLPPTLAPSSTSTFALLYSESSYVLLDVKKGTYAKEVKTEEANLKCVVEDGGRVVRLTERGILVDEAAKVVKRVKVPKSYTTDSTTLHYLSPNTYVLSSPSGTIQLNIVTGSKTPITKTFLTTVNNLVVSSASNQLYIGDDAVSSFKLKSSDTVKYVTYDSTSDTYLVTMSSSILRLSKTSDEMNVEKKYDQKTALIAYLDCFYTETGVQRLSTKKRDLNIDSVEVSSVKKPKTDNANTNNFKSVEERLNLLRSDSISSETSSVVEVGRDDLHAVLIQSLSTGDRQMLEGCFEEKSSDVITSTLRKCSLKEAESILAKITSRVVKRPMRMLELSPWIQGIVAVFKGRVRGLEGLRKLIEERTEGVKELRELEGRLSLIGE